VLPGGGWWIARAAEATQGRVRRWLAGHAIEPVEDAIQWVFTQQSLKAVTLLGHQDCLWYGQFHRGATPGTIVRHVGEDLYRAAEELREWAPAHIAIAAWLVTFDTEGHAAARRVFG
jgi:hypothetical protein